MKDQTKDALRETYASRKVIAEGEEIHVTVIGINFTNDSILQLLTKHADEYLILEYKFRERNVDWDAEFKLLKQLFLHDGKITTKQTDLEIRPGEAGNTCLHPQTEIQFNVNHHTSGDVSYFTNTAEQTDIDKKLEEEQNKSRVKNTVHQQSNTPSEPDTTSTDTTPNDTEEEKEELSEIGYIVGEEADNVNEVIDDILQHHPEDQSSTQEEQSTGLPPFVSESQEDSNEDEPTNQTVDIENLQIETILTQRLLEAEYHTTPTPGGLDHGMMHNIYSVEPLSEQEFKIIVKTDVGEKIIWDVKIPPADEFTNSPIVSLIENQGSGDPLTMADGGRVAIVMLSTYKSAPPVDIIALDETQQWGLVAPSTIKTVQDPEPQQETFLDKLKNINLL